jgi:hypothetical protein
MAVIVSVETKRCGVVWCGVVWYGMYTAISAGRVSERI